jgi:gluconate 5-dehydrogenase
VAGSPNDPIVTIGYASLFDLTDRVALVTGGGGGLGREIARGLADFGARIVLADLDAGLAKKAATEVDGAIAEAVDVTDPASASALAERVQAALGRIDILVNAAGIFRVAPALEMSLADWDAVLRVNLTGTFVMTRAVVPHMLARGRGSVINITSVSSVVANPEYAAYAASKGGTMQLTRVLGLEWCRQGIAVNAVAPAFTDTPLTRGYLERPGAHERVVGKIPMGRLAEARDIVGATVFLASDAAAFMVGQTIFVDGGRTL